MSKTWLPAFPTLPCVSTFVDIRLSPLVTFRIFILSTKQFSVVPNTPRSMFDRFFNKKPRTATRTNASSSRPRPDGPRATRPNISRAQSEGANAVRMRANDSSIVMTARANSIHSQELDEDEDDLLPSPRLSPSPSMSSLPSYRSRDSKLPHYQYDVGHPLSTLDFLTVQAAASRLSQARIPVRRTPVHPAHTLAPYTARGSPWRDVSMSSGWIWMPSTSKFKAHRRLIPHDHPVHLMSPTEQARLRRMGIDPVAKAEFLMLQ